MPYYLNYYRECNDRFPDCVEKDMSCCVNVRSPSHLAGFAHGSCESFFVVILLFVHPLQNITIKHNNDILIIFFMRHEHVMQALFCQYFKHLFKNNALFVRYVC